MEPFFPFLVEVHSRTQILSKQEHCSLNKQNYEILINFHYCSLHPVTPWFCVIVVWHIVSILINIPALINAQCLFPEKKCYILFDKVLLFLWMRWLLNMEFTLNGINSLLTSKFFPIRVDHQTLLSMLKRETK